MPPLEARLSCDSALGSIPGSDGSAMTQGMDLVKPYGISPCSLSILPMLRPSRTTWKRSTMSWASNQFAMTGEQTTGGSQAEMSSETRISRSFQNSKTRFKAFGLRQRPATKTHSLPGDVLFGELACLGPGKQKATSCSRMPNRPNKLRKKTSNLYNQALPLLGLPRAVSERAVPTVSLSRVQDQTAPRGRVKPSWRARTRSRSWRQAATVVLKATTHRLCWWPRPTPRWGHSRTAPEVREKQFAGHGIKP